MDPALLPLSVALGAAAAVLLAALGLLLVVLAGRRRLRRELAESREQLAALVRRVEALQHAPERRPVPTPEREYLITSVGAEPAAPEPGAGLEPISARQFATVALGESLVRILSVGYGVRRALSPENRNRIRFEVRREVRRSRKRRRRDLKEARRNLRTDPGEEAA